LCRKVDYGLWSQATVEMVVQDHLGSRDNVFCSEFGRMRCGLRCGHG
jgi:hypothetical protein